MIITRMASTLCLGPDHRPQTQPSPRVYRERKVRLDDNSFFNLFGNGDSHGERVERSERSRTRRPLPVNTLTGAIIGCKDGRQVKEVSSPAESPSRGNSDQPPPLSNIRFQAADLEECPTVHSGEMYQLDTARFNFSEN